MTYTKRIVSFLSSLESIPSLPGDIEMMNPYQDEAIFSLCSKFYNKYYNDDNQRTIILGINPGRYGAGLTGIPFTDPVKLEVECGIANDMPKKRELSADFIYQLIHAYGGNKAFYQKFYFGSVCPLGFTRNGKNLNYYDDPQLQKKALPFICASLETQLQFGINTEVAYCLGEGKNYKFLLSLNLVKGYFKNIIPLAHPRFIMQYKRKQLERYVDEFVNKLHQPALFIP